MNLRVGSLFTGYGGLDIAVGGDLAWYAEIEPAACQVLAHHYPNVPNLGNITKIDWSQVEPVDVITGGYPCQPFSHAGNRKGKNDVRHLWPNVLDAIRAIRPRYAILENVSGHLTLGFADVLADLAEIGWSCEWGTYRASDVGAPHRRERIFIVAHTNGQGSQGHNSRDKETSTRGYGLNQQRIGAPAADTEGAGKGRDIQQRGLSLQSGGSVGDAAYNGIATHGDANSNNVSEIRQVQKLGAESSGVCAVNAGQVAANAKGARASKHDSGLREISAGSGDRSGTEWGKYAPAIARWEAVLGRNAPDPVVIRTDKRRLNPRFVEWMMGLPDGWVTGHGLSAAKELKMLGNGVVPQQAHAAITQLLERITP